MISSLVLYLLLFSYLGMEFFLRQGKIAKSFVTKNTDNGSTMLIVSGIIIALFVTTSLSFLHIGILQDPLLNRLGIIAMILGISIRIWAMLTLGNAYTRTLGIVNQQNLITTGPYYIIRHPGYLGSILFWIGYSLALQNIVAIIIVAIITFIAYSYRIIAEERMLQEVFGRDYEEYRERSKKLVPLLY